MSNNVIATKTESGWNFEMDSLPMQQDKKGNWIPSKCVDINDIAQIKIQLVAINELIYDLEKKVKFLEGLILCNE